MKPIDKINLKIGALHSLMNHINANPHLHNDVTITQIRKKLLALTKRRTKIIERLNIL